MEKEDPGNGFEGKNHPGGIPSKLLDRTPEFREQSKIVLYTGMFVNKYMALKHGMVEIS